MRKIILIMFSFSLFTPGCRSADQVKDSFTFNKQAMPDFSTSSISIISYCDKDALSIEMTQQLINAMTGSGFRVLSYQDLKNKIPSYPEGFFLGKPWVDANKILTVQNIQTITSASKKISTDYILFVIIEYNYRSSNYYAFINTENSQIITRSYLIEKSTSQIAACFVRKFKPHSKSYVGNHDSSATRMNQTISDSFKLAAEDYTAYLKANISKSN